MKNNLKCIWFLIMCFCLFFFHIYGKMRRLININQPLNYEQTLRKKVKAKIRKNRNETPLYILC